MFATKRKEPLCSGSQFIYLDQNILDAFLNDKLINLKEVLTRQFQVVYSNETLEEIKRAGEASSKYSDAFLSLLERMNAVHISVVLDSDFHETDCVKVVEGDPREIFLKYCESNPIFNDLAESMRQIGFKVCGGRQGESLEDIAKGSVDAFENLSNYIDELICEIDSSLPEIAQKLRAENVRCFDEYKSLSEKNSRKMAEHIVDEKNWSGIKEFRQHFSLEPYRFNNIKPPNILNKIWDVMISSKKMPKDLDSIDDFFMFNKQELIPGQPFLRHQKVLGAYNILNTIGYYPDKPLHKNRGFKRATSDQMHVSLASFCNCLITADERLYKKAEAIYEYLDVPTKVMYFDKII
ncbi:hypothetical protein [Bowmanella pacifica]|nr:hypothetical protein [Bowmanella pacifica]